MENTIKIELAAHILDKINDGILDDTNKDDWHYYAFNEDYYIIGYYNANEWLKKHNIDPFEAIETVEVTAAAFKKMSDEEKKNIIVKDGINYLTQTSTKYACPRETARTLVCKHVGGELPLSELYTDKVFTEAVLRELDEKVIKPTFMLPSIESLEDLAEVTAELEDVEIDDIEV